MANPAYVAEGIKRREDIMDFLITYRDTHGYAPSQEEIAVGLGVSRQTIFKHLRIMEDKGLITIGPNARMISIIG